MFERVKTILLVAIITVLVWVFAEAESLTSKTVRAEVALEVEIGSTRVFELIDARAWRDRLDITLEGPTAAVADAESILRRPIRLRPGMDGFPTDPGEQAVDLFTAMRAWPELRDKGVTISRVDPPTVRVRVDQLAEREIQITPDLPGSALEGTAEVKPRSARLFATEAEFKQLGSGATAIARVSPESLGKLVPGRKEVISNVALTLPDALAASRWARLEPKTVEVTATVRSRSATYTIPSVPVSLVLAPGEFQRWDINIPDEDRFVSDVTVTGPTETVDAIRQGSVTITAQAILSFEELERSVVSKEVVFVCTPHADLQFKADNPRVRMHITKRPPAAEPAAGSPPP